MLSDSRKGEGITGNFDIYSVELHVAFGKKMKSVGNLTFL